MDWTVTAHALERYIQRCHPDAQPAQAQREIVAAAQRADDSGERTPEGHIVLQGPGPFWPRLVVDTYSNPPAVVTVLAPQVRDHRGEQPRRRPRRQ